MGVLCLMILISKSGPKTSVPMRHPAQKHQQASQDGKKTKSMSTVKERKKERKKDGKEYDRTMHDEVVVSDPLASLEWSSTI